MNQEERLVLSQAAEVLQMPLLFPDDATMLSSHYFQSSSQLCRRQLYTPLMPAISRLSHDELLTHARGFAAALAAPEGGERRTWDPYWNLIRELHARDDDSIWSRGAAWTQSKEAWERWLGIDILSQYGRLLKPHRQGADGAWETDPQWPNTPLGLRAQHLIGLRLTDADDRVVAHALTALGHLEGAGDFLADLWSLTTHSCEHVRHAAIQLLADHHPDDPGTLPVILELSRNEQVCVRAWATREMGIFAEIYEVDTPALRDALVGRLADPDLQIRSEAMAYLASLRDPRVLLPLHEALAADDVDTLAVEAAEKLADSAFLLPLLDLRPWWDADAPLLERAIVACGGEAAEN